MIQRSRLSQVVWLNIYVLGLIGIAATVLAQEDVFEYRDFSVCLPEGWVKEETTRGSEKELIGSLKSQSIPGTSVLLFCYKDGQHDYRSVRIVGLKTIASVFPKGQEMLKRQTQVKTDGGLTAHLELWRGAADAGGRTAFLQAPMGIMETKDGWILMLGFTPDATGAQLEKAFVKMIQSAK